MSYLLLDAFNRFADRVVQPTDTEERGKLQMAFFAGAQALFIGLTTAGDGVEGLERIQSFDGQLKDYASFCAACAAEGKPQ